MRFSGVQLTFATVVLLFCAAASVNAQNVTQVLAAYPNYSTFNKLLSATGVINEVESRNSLTFLVPANSVLDPFVASHSNLPLWEVADAIRYHILLQYLDVPEVQHLNNGSGLITTLYQTTGRAAGQDGFVNITDEANGDILVGPISNVAPPQISVLTNITQIPYNYSFFEINGVLVPVGLGAAPPSPPPATPVPAPAKVPSMAPTPATTTAPVPATTTAPVPATKAPTVAPISSPILAPVGPSVPTLAPTQVPTAAPTLAPIAAASTPSPVAATGPSTSSPPSPPPAAISANSPATSPATTEGPGAAQGPSHGGGASAAAAFPQSTTQLAAQLLSAIAMAIAPVFIL